MGGITQALFGGSSNKSSGSSNSSNQAFGFLKDRLGGTIDKGSSAMDAMSGLLGIGGGDGGAAFNNYLDSSAFGKLIETGSKAITGNNAAKGLLTSGATGKALATFGQDAAQQKLNEYMGMLSNMSQQGLAGAGIVSGAGGVSTSTQKGKGSSSNGILNTLLG